MHPLNSPCSRELWNWLYAVLLLLFIVVFYFKLHNECTTYFIIFFREDRDAYIAQQLQEKILQEEIEQQKQIEEEDQVCLYH